MRNAAHNRASMVARPRGQMRSVRSLLGQSDATDDLPMVEAALQKGYMRLEDEPPRELVLGIIGSSGAITETHIRDSVPAYPPDTSLTLLG